jgi:tetratricopeptide (TPR) repeat protein
VRQGTWQFHQVARGSHVKARELFRNACIIDPYLAEAPIWLARVSAGLVAYGWSDNPSQDIKEGLDAALRAIRLDDKNPYSHYALAICSAYGNTPEQAVLAGEKAIELAPSFALGHLVLGMAHLFRGSAADAVQSLRHGLTLNLYDPQNFVWYDLLALAHLTTGDAQSALDAATRSRKVRPSWRPTYEILAVCCAELGHDDQVQDCVQAVSSLDVPPGDALQPARRKHPNFERRLRNLTEPRH